MKAQFIYENLLNERDLLAIDPLVKNKINQLLKLDADYNDHSIKSLKLTPMGIEFDCWGSKDYISYLIILLKELNLNKFLSGEPFYDKRRKVYVIEWAPEYSWLVDKPLILTYDYRKKIAIDTRTKQVFEKMKANKWQK